MPRARWVFPNFFTHGKLVDNLPPWGRLFYEGTWCEADDSGVFYPDVSSLRHRYIPDCPSDTECKMYYDILVALHKYIEFRGPDGKVYAWIPGLLEHNNIVNPSGPRCPLPPWVVWHGPGEFGRTERSKFYYEIQWEKVPKFDGDGPLPTFGKKRKETPTWPEDSEPYKLAVALRDCILENKSDAKTADTPAKLQRWAAHFDLLLRVDERKFDEALGLIKWATHHHFWRRNILSAEKFRTQWDRLCLDREGEQRQASRQSTLVAPATRLALEMAERHREEEEGTPHD
jgi:hypothetical protein